MGFGRSSNATVLGQPLEYSVLLTADPGEVFTPDCVSAEVQSGDNKLSPQAVGLRLDAPSSNGSTLLRIFTNVRIEEPVVSVSVSVGCPPRVTRKFVAFVDPPVLVLGPSVPANSQDSQTAAVPERRAVTTPIDSGRPARRVSEADAIAARTLRRERQQAAKAAQAARAARAERVRVVRAPAATERIERAPPSASTRINVASSGGPAREFSMPRLRLETAESPTMASSSREAPATSAMPALPATPTATPPATAPALDPTRLDAALASDAERELRELERLRVQKLEENFNRLMVESKATQQSLALLQARLREAEESRYANPLVYTLIALVALLLAAVAWLFWRQSRMKREPAWWDSSMAVPPSDALAAESPGSVTPTAPVAAATADALSPGPVDAGPPTYPSALSPVGEMRMLSTATAAAADADAGRSFTVEPDLPTLPSSPRFDTSVFNPSHDSEVTRELSVEELIDLEQQAEFFIVLGQDNAAIDLLMGHVRSSGGTSPMPYMKLLEIYRRRGERDQYERIREGFNRRFNAFAPDWESDASAGRSIEGYPAVLERIQHVWKTPAEAVSLLESLVFRRESGDSSFDLPAFSELLFLYAQARDQAERDDSPGDVDLLLPFESAPDLSLPVDAEVDKTRSAFTDDASVDFELVDLSHLQDAPKAATTADSEPASGPAHKP